MLDLHLEADLRSQGLVDLADSLPEIRRCVTAWWKNEVYLPEFTDHGPDHSERVANYAWRLATTARLPVDKQLSPIERYILWTSAWLHDVGMQVTGDTPVEDLGPVDRDRIRKEHPHQSYTNILHQPATFGLPDDNAALHQAVAYVARAHGTSYYSDTINTIKKQRIDSVEGRPVNSALLAAILLMADELDLYYGRARAKSAKAKLGRVSASHALRHQVVLESNISHSMTDGAISIVVRTQQGSNLTADEMDEIEFSIVTKLRRQIAMIEKEFTEGFVGFIHLSKHVKVDRTKNESPLPSKPQREVINLIEAENLEAKLIDHKALLSEVASLVRDRRTVFVQGQVEGFDDVDGREDLLRAAVGRARIDGLLVLDSWVLFESLGAANRSDVLRSWIRLLNSDYQFVSTEPSYLFESFLNLIAERDAHIACFVSSIDRLSGPLCRWMVETAFPAIHQAGDVSIVATLGATAIPSVQNRGAVLISAADLNYDQVALELSKYLPRTIAEGEAGLRREYQKYREQVQLYARQGV